MPYIGKAMDRRRRSALRRRQLNGERIAASWNAAHPVGTLVRYSPIEGVPPVETRTQSKAFVLGDGNAAVLVEGNVGWALLSHIEVI